jgi:hypothetical protein
MKTSRHGLISVLLVTTTACGPDKSNDGEEGNSGGTASESGDDGGTATGASSSGGGATSSGGTETGGSGATNTQSETCEMIEQVDPPVDTCDLHTCEEVSDVWNEVRQTHRSCDVEGDCVVVSDTFDFTCDCGDAVNTDGAAAQEPLRSRWSYLGCDPDCGPSGEDCGQCDCEPPSHAVCTDGQCQGAW